MKRIGIALILAAGVSAQAQQPISIQCSGVSRNKVPLALQYRGGRGSKMSFQTPRMRFPAEGYMELRIVNRRMKAPDFLLHNDDHTDTAHLSRTDNGKFAIIYDLLEADPVSLYRQRETGDVEHANCAIDGDDPRLTQVLPDSALKLWQTVVILDKKTQLAQLQEILQRLGGTPDTLDDLPEFFDHVFDYLDERKAWGSPSDVLNALCKLAVEAAMLAKVDVQQKLTWLGHLTGAKIATLPSALTGLAQSEPSPETDALIRLAIAKIPTDPNLEKTRYHSLVALATILFDKKWESLPSRSRFIDQLFSAANASFKQDDFIGASLPTPIGRAGALLNAVPSSKLPADAQALVTRVFKHPRFDKTAAVYVMNAIQEAYAYRVISADEFTRRLQHMADLRLLDGVPLTITNREILFARSEEEFKKVVALEGDDREVEFMKIALTASTNPFVTENVLQWLLTQDEALSNEAQIVQTVAAQLPSTPDRYLAFSQNGHYRGLTSDLLRYAFHRNAVDPAVRAQVVSAILDDGRTPGVALYYILNALRNIPEGWTPAETARILEKAVRHQNFFVAVNDRAMPATGLYNLLRANLQSEKPNLDIVQLTALALEVSDNEKFPAKVREPIKELLSTVVRPI